MTHESTASITRERKRRNKKKKVGEKERQRFCFGLAHSCMWIIIFFLLLLVFFFFFFFEKDLLVCFNLLYIVIFLFLVKLYVVTGQHVLQNWCLIILGKMENYLCNKDQYTIKRLIKKKNYKMTNVHPLKVTSEIKH